ncbi:MAG TPA: DUF1178 family protein [Novosphingobium sp.]|nr:DUF1178 family protein [Novosphingobium sp.]
MIVFELSCPNDHRFEGWFGSSDDFAAQHARGLVACPQCGSTAIAKAPMAPRLSRKGNQQDLAVQDKPQTVTSAQLPPEAAKLVQALATMQAEALKQSRWVGDKFADESRAIHYGERDAEVIHGQATRDEAEALLDEGITVAPLLFPVAPPEALN